MKIEESKRDIEKIRSKIHEAQAELKINPDPQRKITLNEKIRVYRAMIRDIQFQINHYAPPAKQKKKKVPIAWEHIDGFDFDFFERCMECSVGINGDIEIDEQEAEPIQDWLKDGMRILTEKQLLYLLEYFNNGYSMEYIAAKYHVRPSTISRVIRNGIDRLLKWVNAKRSIEKYNKGKLFDWVEYIKENQLLSERQKEIILLIMADNPKSRYQIASKLGIHSTTISNSFRRTVSTLSCLNIPKKNPSRVPSLNNWKALSLDAIAKEFELSLAFQYRYNYGNQSINGLTKYQYELWKRFQDNRSVSEISEELGISKKAVQSARYAIQAKIKKIE